MKLLLSAILFIAFYNVSFSQSPEELYNRGNYFIQKGQMDSAMSSFNQALEKDSTYYRAYHGRGTVYLSSKKYIEAIKDYTTCIRQKFNYADAFYGRGIAYLGSGKNEKACQDFQEAMNFGLAEAKEAMVLYCR